MRIQADVTTYMLNCGFPFFLDEKESKLAETLDSADINTLRLSVFSQTSKLLTIDDSLSLYDIVDINKQKLYLCVHCSDTWADPSHQQIPEAWSFANVKQLKTYFTDYLISVFEKVIKRGIQVKYIQVGNEISNGMLWPFLTKPYEYVEFIKIAHILCREYFPSALIVLHTDLSYSPEKAGEWYELMEMRKVDYDLVGLSYYPVWHGPLKQLKKTIDTVTMVTRKNVILCEVGYMNTEEKTSAWFGHWKCDDIPYSPEGQKEYMDYFKEYLSANISGLHSEMFYWGALSYMDDIHFPVSLFDRQGKALPAFYQLNK
ncbi:MAG: arabinogalactan endo-1,4-beta-galactosidase [Prevotella sp.]|jgi:arabinogalactan endo-1,4-beta-galactosidase|nr:arabinogalactan endo-1,4-beta-galactosidase [Prevotella sp.]